LGCDDHVTVSPAQLRNSNHALHHPPGLCPVTSGDGQGVGVFGEGQPDYLTRSVDFARQYSPDFYTCELRFTCQVRPLIVHGFVLALRRGGVA
jgi:hypothetical protein